MPASSKYHGSSADGHAQSGSRDSRCRRKPPGVRCRVAGGARPDSPARPVSEPFRASRPARAGACGRLTRARGAPLRSWRSGRPEGQYVYAGHRDHGVLAHPGRLHPAVRCDGRRTPRGGGSGDRRENELRRIRDGLLNGELRVRPDAQSMGARSNARRLQRRLGGRRRSTHGPPGTGIRYRRIDSAACRPLRRCRIQAVVRRVLPDTA